MTRQTPLATPIGVPVPVRVFPTQAPALAPRPLIGPIVVQCEGVEHELRTGSLLVGRLTECDIVIDEALVSRMHARVCLTNDGVTLEDLHSTNGVYVNGSRIVHAVALNVGDRVWVGTQELVFQEIRTDPAPPPSAPDPPSGGGVIGDPPTKVDQSHPLPIPVTARAEALELLGTMARRLANEHKATQAPRLLGPHLKGILQGARSGLVVPDALSTLAAEYALDLAHWTSDTGWLDYVVELHLVTKRILPKSVLAAMQRAERWLGLMDRRLLEYYIASFASRSKNLTESEKTSLRVLRRMSKKK